MSKMIKTACKGRWKDCEMSKGYSHNVGLVDGRNLVSAILLGVVESVPGNTLTGLERDELDALHDTIDNFVLDTTVLSLGVFSDEDGVDIVVGRLVADDGPARSDVGKEREGPSQRQVHGNVTLSDGCRKGT